MTAERRLAKVKASLSALQLVLRWLDEAHAFGDLESYTRTSLGRYWRVRSIGWPAKRSGRPG